MSDLPIIVTQSGAQPTPPKTLLSNLITNVSAIVPGYTANLPAGLITDLASTATGAVALIDSAMVDTINSVTPYGANVPMLMQLGNIYGVTQGKGYNTSVYVIFMGLPGFVIPKGLIVSDGNYQYAVQNNTIVPSGGQTSPVYCLATNSGTWAVPAGSVTQVITSVPSSTPLTCTNVTAGVSGADKQSEASYRSQVMRAGMFAVQGTPDCLKAALEKVSGVSKNLISYRQVSVGKWAIIVGGGEPNEVANAIYQSIPDISVLTGDVNNPGGDPPENITVTIIDYPDSYDVPFILPTAQNASVIITWNVTSDNYVDPENVSSVTKEKIVDYINSIFVGVPISIYQIQNVFLSAISSLVKVSQVSLIDVVVAINGSIKQPEPETGLIYGDSYGYFTTDQSNVTVQQYGSTRRENNPGISVRSI
ncbi:hypothetical protein AL485_25260 [Serratia liquefaciens]|uniref:baseplate J/gp47 family protein n=1 Tax=Serratia liquefaciens TaxID=614 RepID=UPI0009006397|nr:baseplate J/gp47 family protein [Serratia liquefaciens]AUW40059.1 hypothetical protein AL485_25260 [Serratia liquefaciens]